MGFLRQNLFYMVLIAAVSVGGGGMGFVYLGWSGQWEEKLNERRKVVRELDKQSKMEVVNPESVRIEKRRVETIREAAADIATRSAEWNHRAVLQIPGIDKEGNAVKIATFPFKGEIKGSTRFDFTQEYIKEVQAFLRKLDATRPPTPDEINDQIDKAFQRIELRRILAARRLGPETPDAPTDGRTPDPAGESIQAQSKEEGMATALVSRANGGAVYATLESFDSYFGTALPSATDTELWEAQLNLWVQQDLVEAIGKTNQVAHDRSPHKDKKLRVPNAAIKRLVQINVAEEYFAGGASATGGSRSSRETLGGYDDWEGRGRGDREDRGRRGRSEERRYEEPFIDAGAEAGEAANLTQRITYQDFDVIHYSFTVIMPLRYLVLLEEQLQRLPYHTVRGHSYRLPSSTDTGNHYFGTDPVMSVTIEGEMLLVTSWVRPLMPKGALEKLGMRCPSAIRPEDGLQQDEAQW